MWTVSQPLIWDQRFGMRKLECGTLNFYSIELYFSSSTFLLPPFPFCIIVDFRLQFFQLSHIDIRIFSSSFSFPHNCRFQTAFFPILASRHLPFYFHTIVDSGLRVFQFSHPYFHLFVSMFFFPPLFRIINFVWIYLCYVISQNKFILIVWRIEFM